MVETATSNLAQKMSSWDSSGISQPFRNNPVTDGLNHQRIESIMENELVKEDIKISPAVTEALSRIMKLSTQKEEERKVSPALSCNFS